MQVAPRTRLFWLIVAIVNTVAVLYNGTLMALGLNWWATNIMLGFNLTTGAFFWSAWWKSRPRARVRPHP